MADNKAKVGAEDRRQVAGDQEYEVARLADKFGISWAQARALIQTYGNDRSKIEEAAKRLRG